jgi:hypothetical protein
MKDGDQPESDASSKRRWTLPRLGGAVFLAVCALVYATQHWRQVRHDRAVAALFEVGAVVEETHDDPSSMFYLESRLQRALPTTVYDRIPYRFRPDAEVYALKVVNDPVRRFNDESMKHIHGLKDLGGIDLSYSDVTDAGLAQLKDMNSLQEMYLDNTRITDKAMAHLPELPHLRLLSMVETKIGDDGLRQLAGAASLEELDLNSTKVTDSGLVHLRQMSRLEWVGLFGTAISVEAVQQLKRDMPDLRIEHDLSHEVFVD